MSAITLAGFDRRLVPLTATLLLFFAMVGFGAAAYDGFFAPQVFLNLAIDNAFLLIAAVGMTFVILTGGIDLSVGSVLAFTTMAAAALIEHVALEPVAGHASAAGGRRRVRRLAGISHSPIPAAAVHRHARRHVRGARTLLSHRHRVDSGS